MPASLRGNRDFLLLWTGEAVSELGSSMTALVLPIIAFAVTGSTTRAGLVGTVALVATLVVRLPAGALVDRWRRDRVLLLSNLAGAALFASVVAAAATDSLTLAQLLVVAGLGGVRDAFFSPAMSAAVRTVVPEPARPLAYSRIEARGHGAAIVGPPLGGALYSVARWVPFLVDAVSFAASAFAVTRLRTALPAPAASGHSVRADAVDGVRYLWRHRVVRALMLWGAVLNLAGMVVFVGVTLRLVRAGVHPATIGLIDTIASAAGLLGALLAPRVIARVPTSLLTITTALVVAAVFAGMAPTSSVWEIGALFAIGTFLLPANNAGISSYLAFAVPDEMQGRFNAAAGFVAGGLAPAGPVLAGALLATVGGAATTVVGAGLVAASIVPLLLSREALSLGRPDTWAAAAPAPAPES